ncbi:restriction endonuclease subunit S [Vibrio parahaemolyticus]|uniref:restriction endonuclease subunit S n=1 Tax=Vibrio parahaemolyticus TaxID=670 RepID=UPI00355D0EF1|nr:restriction endonuclease subunit S [Vibrio parahaemolyticus]EJG0781486.1 restriction endonuclease subunit S [Vibrio parahaemolyticus]
MVPKGWVKTNFGSVTNIANGQVDPKIEPYSSMLHIGPENVVSNSGQIIDVMTCKESNLISGKYEFDEDAIVYSKIRPNLNKVCQPGFKGVCSADMYPIWAKSELDIGFLFQYMLGPKFYKIAVAMSMRTGMPKINRSDLNTVPLLLPPIAEQKKIAQILSSWDKAITTTEQLISNSQQQKKALMQQLLTGKKRLLDKNGVRFRCDWKEESIGSLLKEVKRPVIWNDDAEYRLLSVKRRSEGVVLREVLKGHQILTKKMNIACAGDFLISKMQVVHGASGLVAKEFDGHHVSGSYICLVPKGKDNLDMNFFSWFAKQKLMYHKAYLCSYGVHIEKLTFNFQLFLKEKIVIPSSLEEQQKIAALLSSAERTIDVLQQKLEALKQEKRALMQQLLTGKNRVKIN